MGTEIDKDLKEIIDVIAKGVTVGIEAFKDGFQTMDIFKFIETFAAIPEAVKDAGNALHYLKDMTEEKEAIVIAAVVEKLEDTSEQVQGGARVILRALSANYMAVMFFAKKGEEPVA